MDRSRWYSRRRIAPRDPVLSAHDRYARGTDPRARVQSSVGACARLSTRQTASRRPEAAHRHDRRDAMEQPRGRRPPAVRSVAARSTGCPPGPAENGRGRGSSCRSRRGPGATDLAGNRVDCPAHRPGAAADTDRALRAIARYAQWQPPRHRQREAADHGSTAGPSRRPPTSTAVALRPRCASRRADRFRHRIRPTTGEGQ